MAVATRKNIEAECLLAFDQILTELGCPRACRGQGAKNQFDPDFGLVGRQQFQFGDLRCDYLEDRIVVVEVESGGGTTNLVKYWPQARRLNRPLLLLHGFGQGSANDYLSHLRLWDFLWGKMREDLWADQPPKMFAMRFQYTHADVAQLHAAAETFRLCLIRPLDEVLSTVFHYGDATLEVSKTR